MPLDDLQCRLCSCIVDQPVQASCRKLVCSACHISHLNLRSCDLASFLCPFCRKSHEITATSFPAATEITMTVLGDVFLTCDKPCTMLYIAIPCTPSIIAVVDFIAEWRVEIGMLGEQGAESIHIAFNQLACTYANMTNGVERLKSMVTEHYQQICPENVARQVPPAKSKNFSYTNFIINVGHVLAPCLLSCTSQLSCTCKL